VYGHACRALTSPERRFLARAVVTLGADEMVLEIPSAMFTMVFTVCAYAAEVALDVKVISHRPVYAIGEDWRVLRIKYTGWRQNVFDAYAHAEGRARVVRKEATEIAGHHFGAPWTCNLVLRAPHASPSPRTCRHADGGRRRPGLP
jgi:hypothetical protein